MTAIKAYYDGKNFIPLQPFDFKPRQQVLIVVDETEDKETPAQKFLKLSTKRNRIATNAMRFYKERKGRKTRTKSVEPHADPDTATTVWKTVMFPLHQ